MHEWIPVILKVGVALYNDDFAKIFSELLGKSGVSCYQISKFMDLDQAYLSRLKNGE
jgi:hypothetical protein